MNRQKKKYTANRSMAYSMQTLEICNFTNITIGSAASIARVCQANETTNV